MRRNDEGFRGARACMCGAHGFVGLSRGHVALFDPADLGVVSGQKWTLIIRRGLKYASSKKNGGQDLLHRLIAATDGRPVDHKDGDGMNNQRDNLRPCDQSGNITNQRRKRLGASGFKGVYPARKPGRFYARCAKRGQNHLGSFESAEDAARAYDAAAVAMHGDFALTNEMLGLLPKLRRRA